MTYLDTNKPQEKSAWWRPAGRRRSEDDRGRSPDAEAAGVAISNAASGLMPGTLDGESPIERSLHATSEFSEPLSAVISPPRPSEPAGRPAPEPGVGPHAHPDPPRQGVAEPNGLTANVHAGTRTRTRVALVLVITAALVAGAVVTARALVASSSTNFPGLLVAARPVELNFAAAGTLQTIDVVPGQRVSVGEVLATENGAALVSAVQSDRMELASDEQRLAALLGPAAAITQQEAAAAYQKVETLAASQEAKGAMDAAKDESLITAAQHDVTSATAQLGSDTATYDARCTAPTRSPCPSLRRVIVVDQHVLARAKARVKRAESSLAAAQVLDTTLTNLATREQVAAQQDRAAVTATVAIEMSDARDAVAGDEAKLAADLQSLEGTTLTSPANGTVQAVSGQPGELVDGTGSRTGASHAAPVPGGTAASPVPTSVGQPAGDGSLVTIDAAPGLEAVAQVPEQDIAKIAPGQHATVSVDALGGRAYRATVEMVEPVPVNVQGAVYFDVVLVPVRGSWKGGLLPGMTVNATLP